MERRRNLVKENNIVKRKFKKSVAISQEKEDSLLDKKEERKVISDIWIAIITQTKLISLFFYSLWTNKLVFNC